MPKWGAQLASKWKLPEPLCEAIRYHHDAESFPERFEQIARAVAMGAMISTALEKNAQASAVQSIERISELWYGGGAPEVGSLLEEVAETSQTLAKLFEQDIGMIPDTAALIERAREQGLEHQIGLERKAEQLQREAFLDGLTQIANRRCFDVELERAYNEFLNRGVGFGVLFFDADKFKVVNDTYGHAAGDAVLVEMARRATQVVGDEGILCRYGGEEFAAILAGAGLERSAEVGQRIREAIASDSFDTRAVEGVPDTLDITVSVGVSSTDAAEAARLSGAEQVVHEADGCVYEAKSDGRNNVKVWGRSASATKSPASPRSVKPAAQPEAKQPRPLGAPESRGEILLVEDDALAATLVISLIKRRAKVGVRWLKAGDEAIELIEAGRLEGESRPSLILCDYTLPGRNGHEVLRAVRGCQALSGVPFYMLTGNTDEQTRARTLELGATLYIHKNEFCGDINRWVGELISPASDAAA